ncbi:glycerol-3-phosphate 1-O-acyltransferase PlsY [Candidatus Acidulodesulfobacterium sp. H_13]|uniref:glycerol-3-phosphate 1-O-acyltransferase PlsY n=1 Tax=Candidatus Acidulodesulfobacterium sp. H_13 TaxID=3395470 RepID=UPI003AF6E64D
MIILSEIFYIIASYLIGSFPTSAVIARLKGVNLAAEGSGNLGATNVSRVIGRKFGIITLTVDTAKGFIPVFIAIKLFPASLILISIIIIAPVLGHCYSVFIKFKGGKGVATGLGVFLAISPEAVIIAFSIFLLILLFSKYVSLSSMVSAFFMPFLIFYTLKNIYIFAASSMVAILIIYKHYPNIKRLLSGTEHEIKIKK